ncbi:hypothetical protein KJA16_00215 [Patescibacteria group bacterium]|nr:hypothetical protein [Patescibacteria group bacterium]
MEERVLQILKKNPNKLVSISGWDFIGIDWEVIKSMGKRGLIKIHPFPQGSAIFIGLNEQNRQF